MQIIRDSPYGQFCRFITRKKVFRYPEEFGDDSYLRYISETNAEKKELQHTVSSSTADSTLPRVTDEESYGPLTLTAQVSRARSTRSNADPEANTNNVSVKSPQAPDAEVIGWSCSHDQDNPQNWSITKKCTVTAQICYMTFAVYVGAGIYSPSVGGIVQRFNVSEVTAVLGLTTFVAGYGLGPMFWAPLSEIPAIGRNKVYLTALLFFVCFQPGVALASNFGMLLAFRFLTGFIGSPVLAIGGASLSDMWSPEVLSYAIGCWGATAVCGPILGPLLGGFAVQAESWKWSIWILMWASGISLFISLFFLPETSAAAILFERAARIRKVTGNPDLRSASELEAAQAPKKDLVFEALVRPFQLCFTEPVIFVLNLYVALIYGILYLFFEAFPIVFMGNYHFNLGENGLAFLGPFIGSCIGTAVYFMWIAKVRNKKIDVNGRLSPEEHLPPAILGGIFITGSMLWFAWVSRASIHWIVPIISVSFFAAGGCWMVNACLVYLMAGYPKYAASALASNDFMRAMVAAAFPVFGHATFTNLGIGWACTMLGLLTAVFIPAPILFYKYGSKLRMMSRKANHEL